MHINAGKISFIWLFSITPCSGKCVPKSGTNTTNETKTKQKLCCVDMIRQLPQRHCQRGGVQICGFINTITGVKLANVKTTYSGVCTFFMSLHVISNDEKTKKRSRVVNISKISAKWIHVHTCPPDRQEWTCKYTWAKLRPCCTISTEWQRHAGARRDGRPYFYPAFTRHVHTISHASFKLSKPRKMIHLPLKSKSKKFKRQRKSRRSGL